MRLSGGCSHGSTGGAAAALLMAVTLAAGNARAQDAGSVDARLRALEARVSALEGRPSPAASATAGVPCTALGVNGSAFPPGVTLTVAVNGATVGVHEGNAGGDISAFMRPGPNTVSLAFSAPGTPGAMGTQAELRCLPPGSRSSRTEILSLRPTAGRLSAQTQVNLVPR